MKTHQITFWKTPPISVMTYWVHRALDGESLDRATRFDPPRPGPVGGKGWPVLLVEVDGVEPLPSSRALSRGFPMGPNSHWLSRLPKKAKTVKHRETAVKYLREIRGAFAAVAERSP